MVRKQAPPFDVTASIVVWIVLIVRIGRSPIAKTVYRKTVVMVVMTMASVAINQVAARAKRSRTSARSDQDRAPTCWRAA